MAWLVLLVAAAAAVQLLPNRLARARWVSRSPSLGVVSWLVTAYAAVIAVLMAAASLVMQWHSARDVVCTAWRACLDAVRGAHGGTAQIAAVAGSVAVIWLIARLGVGAWLVSVVSRLQRRRHADLVGFVGRPSAGLGATVVPHPAPAAYVVPGRRPQMVITSGALAALDQEQMRAVLAHERAHCAGRHHVQVAAASLLARAFPWVPACRAMEAQVRRLVELRADDLAVRQHRPIALARALLAMANVAPAVPPGGLSAGGHHTVERVRRLLDPPPPLPAAVRSALTGFLCALPATPFVVILVDLTTS